MKTKTFLFATTFMMMAACMNTSCSKYADEFADSYQGAQTDAAVGVEHVKLNLSAPEVALGDGSATRAALQADGKSMTDIYIFDYDQTSGKLLQVFHQTGSAEDFRPARYDAFLWRPHLEGDCYTQCLPYPAGCRFGCMGCEG